MKFQMQYCLLPIIVLSLYSSQIRAFSPQQQCHIKWHNSQLTQKAKIEINTYPHCNKITLQSSITSNQNDESDNIQNSINNNDSITVEFPPPLSNIDRLKRAAKFWSNALPVVASYYTTAGAIKFKETVTGEKMTQEEEQIVWDETHNEGANKLATTITSLKGFYVKTAQIIASRQDLFPKQYTEALSDFTDNVDPMPASLAKAVITKELLHRDEKFSDVFSQFDDIPLGAASVAQVHKATLTEKYGGPKEVAIKIQRPSIESKLMGDIANLKALSKPFRDSDVLPVDYYTVFSELEKQLQDEFDFVAEAVAMDRIHQTICRDSRGLPCEPPLVVPRPVPGLVSRRVLVMDYLPGVPLSRAREEMLKRGVDPNSPEAILFGKKLLRALTEVFGRCILETGFFHAGTPHPGNIFVLDDGSIGLIDFGQVKQISGRARETLAKVMIALDERESDTNPPDLLKIGNLALELGVGFKDGCQKEAEAAVAMWLFDGTVKALPGGYDDGELSPNSPLKELKSFPQDLVLVGRSSVLIKGLSNRLGIRWSLAKEWAPIARKVLQVPGSVEKQGSSADSKSIRFRDVWEITKQYGKGKAERFVRRLPPSLRTKVAAWILRVQERRDRRKLEKR